MEFYIMRKLKITLGIFAVIAFIALGLWNNKVRSASKMNASIAITSVSVSVAPAVMEKIDQAISVVGTITANNDVAIVSETQGRVVSVNAKVGDQLGAGSVIAQVDDELKKANYLLAEANYQKTKKDLERNEELFKNNAISTSQIESSRLAFQSAEAQYIVARRQYNDTRITTPIGGIVSSRSVDFGTMVVPGTVIANVVDVSKLKVKIQLAEHDVFKIKNGDKAVVSTDVYPGMEFEARVENISAKADEAHTYPVELSLNNNSKNPLKAGMFARVDFKTFVERTSVVIAREALVGSLKKPQVFVVEGDKAVLRNIVVGVTSSHKIEVLSGLKEGENVVIKGQNNLQDQSTIRVAQ